MLLDGRNPYRGGLPPVLALDASDFDFSISAANEAALGQMADWAVLVYMAADCSLAADMFDDLLEIKAAGSSRTVHLLTLFDGPLLTDAFFARLNRDTPIAEDVLLRFNELNTHQPETLALALRLASAYPARRRLVILAGHGSGWRGALIDENLGLAYRREAGRLSLPGSDCDAHMKACQLRAQERLNQQLTAPGAQAATVDLLAFDACYMGNIEAIAGLSGQAPIMVVSEDLMPGQGFQYAAILADLAADPAQTPAQLAAGLVRHTADFYRGQSPPRSVTLAALHSAGLQPFAEALARLVQTLDGLNQGGQTIATIQYAMEKAWPLGSTGNIDLKGFLQKLLENPLPAAAEAAASKALEAFEAMIFAFAGGGDSDTTNGLSIYAPKPAAFDPDYIRCSNRQPFGLGGWAWLLGGYYLQRLGAEAPSHPLIRSIQDTMQALIAAGVYAPLTGVAGESATATFSSYGRPTE